MEDSLEDIAFLARSSNRVRVLFALAEERGSRQEIGAQTHVSRVTLGRVLADFEAQGWVAQENGEYAITPIGTLVADAFGQFQESVEAAGKLRAVSDWYPDGGFGFDFELLTDATFTTPSQQDPLAPVRTAVRHIDAADELRLLTNATVRETAAALRDRVVDDSLDLTLVGTASIFETMASDHEMATILRELLDAGVPAYRSEADLPFVVAIHDDSVDIGLDDDRGFPAVLIESDHPDVLAWARETFEHYRSAAERLGRTSFPVFE